MAEKNKITETVGVIIGYVLAASALLGACWLLVIVIKGLAKALGVEV